MPVVIIEKKKEITVIILDSSLTMFIELKTTYQENIIRFSTMF